MTSVSGSAPSSGASDVLSVIKILADKLITLRDQHCTTELGLDECRDLENKIVKYYARIVLMMEIAPETEDTSSYIDFHQLLKVIGLSDEGIEDILKFESVADILALDHGDYATFAQKHSLHREETRKFSLFLHQLRRCVQDPKESKESQESYSWSSWSKITRYHSTSSMDRLVIPPHNMTRSQSYSSTNANLLNKVVNKSQPNLSNVVNMEGLNQFSSVPRNGKGTPKKNRPSVLNLPFLVGMQPPGAGQGSPLTMTHSISHRFSSRSLLLSQNCDVCHKMMLFRYGVKCKECNYKCHKECKSKAPASCGLPPQLELFRKQNDYNQKHCLSGTLSPSAVTGSTPASPGPITTMNTPPLTPPASAPCSSKNKQQHFTFPDQQCHSPPGGGVLGRSPPLRPDHRHHHHEPETPSAPSFSSPYANRSKQTTAMATVNVTPSMSSPSVDMEDVTMTIQPVFDMSEGEEDDTDDISEHELNWLLASWSAIGFQSDEDVSEIGSQKNTLPSRKRFLRKSVLSDWGINFNELEIGKKIGDGRTGEVYEGKWHGDVVIKIYKIPSPTKEQLAEFRREVQMLRKVRHENIVLFMGVCMNPPNLCIVTDYIKGKSLHFYIHERGKAYTERQSMQIIEQVSAALGYLHHRRIIHKNLKSTNIHMNDNKKAVICDFGLGSMTDLKLKKGEKGFEVLFNVNLYYLAPEIIRKLQAVVAGKEKGDIELSESTDVYALGTVWYEILAGHWPWPGHTPEQVWWHLSKGLVPDVPSSAEDISRLLLSCWSADPYLRPNAAQLAKEIRALPLPKALQRSPSHPVGLKRTATS